MSSLKRLHDAGETALGAWLLSSSPDAAEAMAWAGLDFIVIDHEHGQGSIESAVAILRALKGTGCAGILRVPSLDRVYIKRALDIGVDGVMVPNIGSVAEAREAVAACRYPPDGRRGAFAGMRAMRYGLRSDYHENAFADLFIALQIESPDAVGAAADIAAVPGIDALFIGPRDLSAALGRLNRFDDAEVQGWIGRAEAAILGSGLILGSTAASAEAARQMFARGYRMAVCGADVTHLAQSIGAVVRAVRGG